jgi:hypothetical protein
VARHANGRIRHAVPRDPRDTALARRIRDRIRNDASHEWAGFPLGILYVTGEISQADYEAGRAFAALRGRFARIMGLPFTRCRAIDWNGGQGRAMASEPSAEEIRTVRRKMAGLEQAILRDAGRQGLSALEETCLLDREPQNPFLLKRCLGILSRASTAEPGEEVAKPYRPKRSNP